MKQPQPVHPLFPLAALNGKPKRYITTDQAGRLCRLVLREKWTEEAFRRYLLHHGTYRTADLYPWEYRQAVVDAEDRRLCDAYLNQVDVVRGGRRERRWHEALDRDSFYQAYSLSQMPDSDVSYAICSIQLTHEVAYSALACREMEHRLASYRVIALTLETARI